MKVAKKKSDLNSRVDEAIEQIHNREYYNGMAGRVILTSTDAPYKRVCLRTS